MYYELWDLESGNMIGDYGTEAEALVVVRDIVEANTPSFTDLLSLGCTEDDGTFRIVAQGRPLAVLADRFIDEQGRGGEWSKKASSRLIYQRRAQARPSRANRSRAARGPQVPAS